MSHCPPAPSTRVLCGLCFTCIGLLIIVLGVFGIYRKPELKEKHQNVEFLIGNKMMEKLAETNRSIEKIMKEISKDTSYSDIQIVRTAVWNLAEMVKKFQLNGTQESECPSGWTPFSFSCYYISSIARTWEDSKTLCEATKSHLVVIGSTEEQWYLQSIAPGEHVWIGLTDVDGDWKWVNGAKYDSTPKHWDVGQPDEWHAHGLGGGEDCACLHPNGEWNDSHCSRLYRYICEKDTI
ncbi:asialoglycoprotein receptor 1-like isoform 2-T2 [Discoglossus pictus]